MLTSNFSKKIIAWYQCHKRDLPWRSTKNPYLIWLSEVILQQTRVEQGLPYYHLFVELFPNVTKLAKASEQEVLSAWQGLGYYSRARNLHRCAQIVLTKYDGVFPKSAQELLKLPGIGPYTAAAIASFCFKEKIAVVDGNVYRVLARIFGIHDDINSGSGQKIFQKKANELISQEHPDSFNQGMMEFGALHCTPKKPRCQDCTFHAECYARLNRQQLSLPVKIKKGKVRDRYFQYVVYRHNDDLWMKQRVDKDIWQGLYDFELIESDYQLPYQKVFADERLDDIRNITENIDQTNDYKHLLSHQRIHAIFFTLTLSQPLPINYCKKYRLKKFNVDQLPALPKSVLISTYLNNCIL